MLNSNHNKKIYSFELGIESDIKNLISMNKNKNKNKNKRKSISAYVRTSTPRRCWEIVQETYREIIKDNSLDIELGLFGMIISELMKSHTFLRMSKMMD